jgi:transcriptional antiterminator
MANNQIGWMNVQQAAKYLGVSERSLKYAITLKKQNKANHTIKLKSYGNRTLINVKSLDETETIITQLGGSLS